MAEVALWNHEGVLVSHLQTASQPLCDHNCSSLAVSEDCWMQAASSNEVLFTFAFISSLFPSPNTISTFPKTELGGVTLKDSCNIPKSCDHLCLREKKNGFCLNFLLAAECSLTNVFKERMTASWAIRSLRLALCESIQSCLKSFRKTHLFKLHYSKIAPPPTDNPTVTPGEILNLFVLLLHVCSSLFPLMLALQTFFQRFSSDKCWREKKSLPLTLYLSKLLKALAACYHAVWA